MTSSAASAATTASYAVYYRKLDTHRSCKKVVAAGSAEEAVKGFYRDHPGCLVDRVREA